MTGSNLQEGRMIRRRTRRNVGVPELRIRENRIPMRSYAEVTARPNIPQRRPGGVGLRRRPLKTAAITITGIVEGTSYADALKEARKQIPLDELEIEESRIRRVVNGGRIIEIPGVDASIKADKLAERLREVLGSEYAVNRPTIKGELRILGLDDTITPEEVAGNIAKIGECSPFDVKVGAVRVLKNGSGSIWAQCPLTAAIKISKQGKIRMGWTMAKVILLEKRQIQCYKCWRFGHVRFNCTSDMDFGGLCFRCGDKGHMARHCFVNPRCIVCEREEKEASHRFGSAGCCFRGLGLMRIGGFPRMN